MEVYTKAEGVFGEIMRERGRDNLVGHISELQQVISDLENSKLFSPFNPYFLKNRFIEKYRERVKRLKKQIEEKGGEAETIKQKLG